MRDSAQLYENAMGNWTPALHVTRCEIKAYDCLSGASERLARDLRATRQRSRPACAGHGRGGAARQDGSFLALSGRLYELWTSERNLPSGVQLPVV